MRTPESLERRDAGVVCRIELLFTPNLRRDLWCTWVLCPCAMRRTLTTESQSQKALEPTEKN